MEEKKCFKCGKEGQLESHFPKVKKKDGSKKEHRRSNNNNSRASQSSKSIKSEISRLKRLKNNTFTTTEANIDKLGDEVSNLTSSDSRYRIVNINFQFHNKPTSFTGPKNSKTDCEDYGKIPGVTTQTGVVLQQSFEEWNIKLLFKNSHAKSIKIDLRNFILLDTQSTMELFCNSKLFGNIYKAKKNMCLQSNEGKMMITKNEQVARYKLHVCFEQKSITNLIALDNIIK